MKNLLILLSASVLLCQACNSAKPASTVKQSASMAPQELVNTRWVLKYMAPDRLPKMEKEVYIQFQPNGALKGFAGCNGFTGVYTISSKKLTISRLLSTKMWCAQGGVEQKFLKALENANGFTLSGDELHLLSSDKEVALFNAVYTK